MLCHCCYVTRERNKRKVVDLKFIYGHTDRKLRDAIFLLHIKVDVAASLALAVNNVSCTCTVPAVARGTVQEA